MNVAYNRAKFTGIVFKTTDPVSKKLEPLYDSDELNQVVNFIKLINIVSGGKDLKWPDVAFGIQEESSPGSGEVSAHSMDAKETLVELPKNEENTKKLAELFKKFGLDDYIDQIKTYDITWLS